MMNIEWSRLAAPQADGYDTEVLLKVLAGGARYGGKDNVPTDGEVIWPSGRARLVTSTGKHAAPTDEYSILPTTDDIVRQGLALLDLWPEVREQCSRILLALCPMTLRRRNRADRGSGHGCSCGQFGDDFGWIYVTADDAWGFAEGIVHEMGHWKLRALGIWFEDWTPLILEHSFEETYASPVRKDKPRPMGAVLHAQYSYIHVARMTSLALKVTERPNQQDLDWAALQLGRIAEGQGTLRANARGTKGAGEPFLKAVDDWTTAVLQDGGEIVARARERVTRP